MEGLAPLPVVIPLLVAAALLPFGAKLKRVVIDATSVATALAVTVIGVLLVARSAHGTFVYWFGSWVPRRGIALGVSFTVDAFGAAMATLCAVVTLAALVFSWRYFEETGSLNHILLLVALAAMTGFSLSGDLFNMFVFFELMSIAAYALTGYEIERARPLEGALNFAITNSVGAFFTLTGIALLYARTGALNLAGIGRVLAGGGPDGLVVVSFTFIIVGFLVKAAIVPFHFWLPDAHSVAPTPLSVMLSGVIVELGLFAIARVYWTAFDGALGAHADTLRRVLIVLGIVTALVGGVLCYAQEHVKRLLAFSTVSHEGLLLIGIAALDPLGMAGSAVYVVGHALTKAALFMMSGILVLRYGTVDENALHSKGRELPIVGALFTLGGLSLAGLPPFGTYLGKALVEESWHELGQPWMPAVFVAASALTGGAVLRIAGRVFMGWGPAADEAFETHQAGEEAPETSGDEARARRVMLVPIIGLLVAAAAWGLVPGLAERAEAGAMTFQDRSAYQEVVLEGRAATAQEVGKAPHPSATGILFGVVSSALAVGAAALGLFRRRLLPARVRALGRRAGKPTIRWLRGLHTGHVGDYVAWITLGAAVLGGSLALALAA